MKHMCQAILVFEAILFGLSIPILVHLADVPTGVAVAVGSVLAVLALVTTGLFRRGAVGDVLGRYVDAEGNIVDPQLDARTVGVSLDRLRGAARAIFVTAGPAKHDIARTVVTSGLCGVLVTDETTARALLEEQ